MVKARKRFGQHFLESAWVAKLVTAIAPEPDDPFVEIGPGKGAITIPLLQRSGRVLAIEVDRDLAAALRGSDRPGLTVVQADVLDANLPAIIAEWQGAPLGPANQVRVVGNLPYNISSPILFMLLKLAAATGGLRDASLMLQREVADRLRAEPGTKEYGVLTVLTALHADVQPVLQLPPGAFRPPPKVSSSVIRLVFHPPTVTLIDESLFVRMVRTVFTQRRKTTTNALKPFAEGFTVSAAEALAAARIDGQRRPETLQIIELAQLADVFASAPGRAVL